MLKTLKNRKSPGLDGLNAELFKYAPDTFLTRLVDFINICWRYGHIPDDWKTAMVIPIFKSGNKRGCNN